MPELTAAIRSVFDPKDIFALPDLAAAGYEFPSVDEIRSLGKRVMFVSSTDYGRAMHPLVLNKNMTCRWAEPSLVGMHGAPLCSVRWVTGSAGQIDGWLVGL